MILKVDPNSLFTNLMNQGFGNIFLRSKGNIQEYSAIEQIMRKVDELSTLLSKVVIDIQEKFTFLEGKLHFYVEGNNKRINLFLYFNCNYHNFYYHIYSKNKNDFPC